MRTFFAQLRRRLIAVLAVSIALQGVIFVAPEPVDAATQSAYRWRNDDGTEATATYAAAQNTALTGLAKNTTTRLRMGVDADGSDATLLRQAAALLQPTEGTLSSSVIDTTNGYAYFGTSSSPATVVKIALGSGAAAPTRIGAVTFNTGENGANAAGIDVANGYAYFVTTTSPGIVVKIALGSGAAVPTRVGALTLNSGENSIASGSIDATNGYMYVGTQTSPSIIVKIQLGAGAALPTRIGAITLNSGENTVIASAIDIPNGYVYFGTNTVNPGIVIKVAVGSGGASPTRTDALTLNAGEVGLLEAVIDQANGYIYFGTGTSPGRVIKVAVGSGAAAPTRTAALTLNSGENILSSSAIDTTNGYAYFGTNTSAGRVVKVELGAGAAAPTRIGAVTLSVSGANVLNTGVIDPANGYAYFGTTLTSYQVVKVELGAGAAVPTETNSLVLTLVGDNVLNAAVIDTTNGYAYFGTNTSPARVVKIALGTGAAAPTIVSSLLLNSGENQIGSAVIDVGNGYAYFGTTTTPGRVVKVELGAGAAAPTRVNALTLNSGENSLSSAVIDTANGRAYFGTATSPGIVVKVTLGAGAAAPTRASAVTLSSGENILNAAAIDTTNGRAYFGTSTVPGIVVKVTLNSGVTAPTRNAALTLNSGEDSLRAAIMDSSNGYAYFGTATTPGRVVKVELNAGVSAPTRTAALTLDTGENSVRSAAIDLNGGYGYFGTNTSPGIVVQVSLGSGASAPTRVTAVTLNSEENLLTSAVIDTVNGHVFVGTGTSPGRVVKLRIPGFLQFRLEYGARVSTCAAISSWTQVADSPVSEHFAMSDSANITNGEASTNSVGVTNGGSSFVAGKVQDTTSEATAVSLSGTQFTEMEYSILARTDATSGGNYCLRMTNAGATTNLTFTQYAQVTIAGGASTNSPTLNNVITANRLKAGASTTYNFGFTLQNAITGTLTITFPAGFTVTAAATSGACAGGTVGTFGFTASTLTAVKTGCTAGALTLSGATVTNHSTPGAYTISWVNDDPGSGIVYIIDDDQVTVTGNVDPSLTFNAGSQASATACDGTFSGNGGTLALGVLTTGAVTSSDASSINHICTRLSTNSSGGASVTVRSLNGTDGLKSTSVPTDTIPSSTTTLVAGTAGYGLCTGSAGGDSGNDVISGSSSPTRSAPFNTTCTNAAHGVGGLTTSAQNLWTLTGPSQNAFGRVYVKAAISGTTAAHADYADTLTFIGTGTF